MSMQRPETAIAACSTTGGYEKAGNREDQYSLGGRVWLRIRL
mgnify:CR=1 FL=1